MKSLRLILPALACIICAGLLIFAETEEQAPVSAQAAADQQSDEAWQSLFDAIQPAELPPKLMNLEWRSDLESALAEAKASNRPLLVTMRCLPCKQCSGFDETVFEAEGELRGLLQHFITVRLTSMRDIDARILPFVTRQDLDVSWWGYFLSPEGGLYGVYGGIDHEGDDSRMSSASIQSAMQRVLDFHYAEDRSDFKVNPSAPDLTKGEAETPLQLEGWESWEKRGLKEANEGECLHCHQVNDIIRQPRIDDGSFDKSTDFHVWPYPENLGITLDHSHGLKVLSVEDKSPADRAKIKAGDVLRVAQNTLLFSEADLRAVLHNLPQSTSSITIGVLRDDKYKSFTFKLKDGWRETDLSWRKSVAEAQVGAHFGFGWPLEVNAGQRKARKIDADSMAIKPWFPKSAKGRAADAGMKANDVVVAVDGERLDIFGRAFLVWFRLRYEPGDKVTLTLADPKGAQRKITYEVAGAWNE